MASDNSEEERLLQNSEREPSSPERGYDSINYRDDQGINNVDAVVFEDVQVAQKRPQYVAAFAATLSALAAGVVLGWTSPISSDLKNGSYHNISITETELGWVGSFTTLGALLMCVPTGFLCDLLGRKTIILLLVVPFTLGWSLLIWAQNLTMLYFGRFLTGLASGSCCIAVPLYTNEIAQKEIRGALGSYFQLMVTIGVFYAYLIGDFFSATHYTIMCALVPLVSFVTFLFQPETPLFHVKKGRIEQARQSLKHLRGPNYNVDIELHSIESGLKDSISLSSLNSIIRQKSTIKALVIAFGLMFFQQFCGINSIIFYTSDIFESSGVKIDPKTASIFVGGFQVAATFVSSLIVDKLGRRKLLMLSGGIMALTSCLLGIFDTLKEDKVINGNNISSYSAIPVISLCVFVVVFSLGFGPVPWIMSAEIFTPEMKSVASSGAAAFNWFLAFFITKFYLDVVDSIGEDKTFYGFAAFSLLSVLFTYFVVIETNGKTIGQIQTELGE